MNLKTATILTLAAVLLPQAAFAATTAANLDVSATVTNSCSISSSPMAFGAYDPISGTELNTTATLSVTCTQGTVQAITLDEGANPGATSTTALPVRRMIDGGAFLGYSLASTVDQVATWGNTIAVDVERTAATSSVETVTVFGRVMAGQPAIAGNYTDTVIATVTY